MIEKELIGTPLEGQAEHFIGASKKYKVDPLFLVAIQYHESKYCGLYSREINSKRHNCAGIMAFSGGKRYLKEYASYQDFIYDHARIMRSVYLDQGLTTIEQVWRKYAPSNESMNSSWGPMVAKKYSLLRSK